MCQTHQINGISVIHYHTYMIVNLKVEKNKYIFVFSYVFKFKNEKNNQTIFIYFLGSIDFIWQLMFREKNVTFWLNCVTVL